MIKELKVIQEECCTPSSKPTIDKAQADKAQELFAALADATRLSILSLLANSLEHEVCVCDITSSFSLAQPTISHHLRILRDAGLIKGDKRGKWVYYSLIKGRAEEIKIMVDQLLGSPEFALL